MTPSRAQDGAVPIRRRKDHSGSFRAPEWDTPPGPHAEEWMALPLAAYQALVARGERQEKALRYVERWDLPTVVNPATGKPMSYESEYGSNGARDHVRAVARAALSATSARPRTPRGIA